MKRALLATTFLSFAAFAAVPAAYAIDVIVLTEGEVQAIVGAPGPDITVNAGAVVGVDAAAAVPTEIMIRPADADIVGAVAVETLVGLDVWTDDNVQVGTVTAVAVTTDGEALLVVSVLDQYPISYDVLAFRASSVRHTDTGIEIGATDAELLADLEGAANAGGAEPAPPAPAPEPPPPAPTPTPTPPPAP
ncbi:MAG: hypothetical protein AB7O56_12195 [Bauldia sp.]